MKQNILITGPPASGKSTLLQNLISGKQVYGIFTHDIKRNGERWGFKVINIRGGKNDVFSSIEMKPHVIGKFGVDVSRFEKIASPAIEEGIKEDNSIIVIDEIKMLSLFSEKYRKLVSQALDTKRVLATAPMKSRHDFLDKIKSRSDVHVHYLTKFNYERLLKEIAREL
ncbi:MAG: nucleoside-triphosphatase [archaeon]